MRALPLLSATGRRLGRDTSGVALLEFALVLPVIMAMSLTGAELTNYIVTKMRISQIALHIADNAARIGSGTQLESKKITEADINDLLTGADLQSGELKLINNGRVILSSFEPVASPNTTGKFRIRWQRCKGAKTGWGSSYGVAGATNLDGIGPNGTVDRRVNTIETGQTMFVEVRYQYTPLIRLSLSPTSEINETASMMVRDRRDTSDDSSAGSAATHPNGVYKVAGVTASTC